MRWTVPIRKPVAAASLPQIEGEGHPHHFLRTLASLWHVAFIVYILFLYILSTYKRGLGEDTASYPGLLSLLIVVLVPGADFFLRSLLNRFFPAEETEELRKNMNASPVFKRAARILLVIGELFLLGRVWGVNFFAFGKESFGEELMRAIVNIALTLLAAYVAWGVIKAALARYLPGQQEQAGRGDEGGDASASRLRTMMPLVMRFIQAALAVIVVMILLSSLGVGIAPPLAGAGVVGIAVGFGAQTLVRDVVSGLFFLMDDAFRKGEYVDIGNVKGTVEGINVRSLVLRHHLGILHTVPYGEISYLSNYSRDWVIVKMEFRVPTDTDVNKVKKIFKQIGADMLEHPVLGADFLEGFKSQGVKGHRGLRDDRARQVHEQTWPPVHAAQGALPPGAEGLPGQWHPVRPSQGNGGAAAAPEALGGRGKTLGRSRRRRRNRCGGSGVGEQGPNDQSVILFLTLCFPRQPVQ